MQLRIAVLAAVALAACGQSATSPPAQVAPPAIATSSAAPTGPAIAPPIARKDPQHQTLFGHDRVDDYGWLRHKDSPEVLAYLNAENAYTARMTAASQPLRDTLYTEMLSRVQETDIGVPVRRGDWLYYSRTEQGKQYPIYCRKAPAADAAEIVILDLNAIGASKKFVGLGAYVVSDDGNWLAYALDTTGFRQYDLRFKDLRTLADSTESIPRVDTVAFGKDAGTVVYVTEDATTKRENHVYRHTVGSDPATDPLIYDEADERFDVYAYRTRSKDYVVLESESKTTTEARVLPAGDLTAKPSVIAPREQGHRYYVDHRADLFYIRTDSGGRNFRIVTAKVSDPGRAQWKEIVPHSDAVMIEDLDVFADHYVTSEREDGSPQLRITSFANGDSYRIKLPEAVYEVGVGQNPDFASTTLRYVYQSLVTPQSVYDYDLTTRTPTLLKRTPVLGGFDPAHYETARAHATAKDGTAIPISLLYAKGTKPDGTHPLHMEGYGSYGYSFDDSFDGNRFSLVDRGVVYAIAHVRGGGELGKRWHDEGRMMSKLNTFNDFIDSGDYLVKSGWAARGRMSILGGSAGGLLMGAVTNMRPDLWRAVVARVPFVDVVNTMLDETLPLTVGEFEEWGNPKVEAQYDYMMKYSPYDNVAAKDYPAMLVETSYNDSQVMYWEPAKYVAKLRASKTDTNPLLLHVNMEPAGHGGQSGRYDRLREAAFRDAFLLEQLGAAR